MLRVPRSPRKSSLPTRDDIRNFVREQAGKVGKREISRAFNISPEHKAELRDILRDLAADGTLDRAGDRRYRQAGDLQTMVVEVTGINLDGEAIARPVGWRGGEVGPPPQIVMAPEPRGQSALAPGQRVLARLRPIGGGRYEGRTITRIAAAVGRVLGIYRPPAPPARAGRVVPTDRRTKAEWAVPPGEDGGAEAGEIVLAEPLPSMGLGLKPVRIVERLGRMGDARSVSLIVIAANDIPTVFPPEAVTEAERAKALPLGHRTDLRDIPLLTIDGPDARDFDDAVFAERDGDGFRLIVAIADVAEYVRPGSALDRAAWTRGNSVYFPDRVVPMLPEALSNGWCSLRPDEDRGCLFVEVHIGPDGRKRRHRFGRGLMRSAARLTYELAQQAADTGNELGLPGGLLANHYAAFRALLDAREARGTLDLDLPERCVVLDDAGHVVSVTPRPRLDSHRLIEEFMVLANVCAAEEMERLHLPCMYRVHAPPTKEKLESLRAFLQGLNISLPPGDRIRPRDLDRVLRKVAGTDAALLVNETILRSQSQAEYNPDNIGHFGLALPRYAHFTSPIRRYSDLLVHRALIRGLKLGHGALTDEEVARFPDTAEHITATERRAATAERDAVDRYLAAYMADKVGAVFDARISGVTRFALFVTVLANGASGIVPISTLPDDYWMHDERTHTLSGRRTRLTFRLAQPVEVRLSEAVPETGSLVFNILQDAPAREAKPSSSKTAASSKKARATQPSSGRPEGRQRRGRKM